MDKAGVPGGGWGSGCGQKWTQRCGGTEQRPGQVTFRAARTGGVRLVFYQEREALKRCEHGNDLMKFVFLKIQFGCCVEKRLGTRSKSGARRCKARHEIGGLDEGVGTSRGEICTRLEDVWETD